MYTTIDKMHFIDKKSGVCFHYSDTSYTTIVVPPDSEYEGTEISIPLDSVLNFTDHYRAETIDRLLNENHALKARLKKLSGDENEPSST